MGSGSCVVGSSVGSDVVGGSVVVGSAGFPKQVHFRFTKHPAGAKISSSRL